MSSQILIADSGATKTEWCYLKNGRKKILFTQGISPYFMDKAHIADLVRAELLPKLGRREVTEVAYYGTGCANPSNRKLVKAAILSVFPGAAVEVGSDILAAARSLCGHQKGIACILGTGSNSCYFNGKKIVRNSPGLGYVLGDEGSGAYLGRKVLQYYLYQTFDAEMMQQFDRTYHTTSNEILEAVYKKPLPNRYLAGFAVFLAGNRGHYMIENIIEDGLNDFFFTHITRYPETKSLPVSFVGGVAWGFRDVLVSLCQAYGITLGKVLKNPMEGLISYHR